MKATILTLALLLVAGRASADCHRVGESYVCTETGSCNQKHNPVHCKAAAWVKLGNCVARAEQHLSKIGRHEGLNAATYAKFDGKIQLCTGDYFGKTGILLDNIDIARDFEEFLRAQELDLSAGLHN